MTVTTFRNFITWTAPENYCAAESNRNNNKLLQKMKLTLVLFRRNRLPNGNLFRGKDRLVQKVEPKHLRQLQRDFAVEEQNMFYLRHPYLSEVESSGHTRALGKPEMRKEQILDKTRRIFKKDVTLYERLQHLRVNESWD